MSEASREARLRLDADVREWIAARPVLKVVPYPDPLLDEVGVEPWSEYVETLWLPLLGPSCVWTVRRLVTWFGPAPDGYHLDLRKLSGELGIGKLLGPTSGVVRSLARLTMWNLAARRDDGSLAVYRRLPPVPPRNVRTLPPHLQEYWQRTKGLHPDNVRLARVESPVLAPLPRVEAM